MGECAVNSLFRRGEDDPDDDWALGPGSPVLRKTLGEECAALTGALLSFLRFRGLSSPATLAGGEEGRVTIVSLSSSRSDRRRLSGAVTLFRVDWRDSAAVDRSSPISLRGGLGSLDSSGTDDAERELTWEAVADRDLEPRSRISSDLSDTVVGGGNGSIVIC